MALTYSAMAVCQGIAAIWMVSSLGEERIFIFIPFLIGYGLFAKLLFGAVKRKGIVL